MAVADCFRKPDTSLFIGLNLPHDIYEKKIPVLIRQEYLHGFAKAINSNEKFEKVNFFGMLSSTCNLDFNRDNYAKILHEDYLEMLDVWKSRDINKPSHQEWEFLPEHYRWSNRYPVDIYPVKEFMLERISKVYNSKKPEQYLEMMKWIKEQYKIIIEANKSLPEDELKKEISKMVELWDEQKQNVASDIELMAEIEHNRWISEKVLAGWTYKEVRDDNRLMHPDLIQYKNLSEEKKMYDRQPSIRMFELKLQKAN